jgi:4-aminobutyrate aminotransferase
MMDRHPLIGDVRGRGCLLGAELVLDRESRAPASDAADAVLYKALGRGLNFKTTMGNVLTLTPPLITTDTQMREAMEIVEESIAEVEQELGMGRA